MHFTNLHSTPPPELAPVKGPNRRGLWIAGGAIVAVLVLGAVVLGISGSVNRSTPSSALTTYCHALVMKDYQTIYNQYSSAVQSQLGNEAQFAAGITSLKIKGCTVSNVNDTAGTGVVTYLRGDRNKVSATETLVQENGTWRINGQQFISTPTEILLIYCGALKWQDYQTAYEQLSSAAQSHEGQAQFAASFNSITVAACTVSNVNDTKGTGTITYSFTKGSTVVPFILDYTLVRENGTWKINGEQKHTD